MERIEKLKEFLKVNPTDSFILHAMALEYIKIGDDTNACALFESIIKREPSYVGSYYHLAKLYERSGETDKAIKIYDRGMEEAKRAGEDHVYNELKSGLEELMW